MTTTDFYIGQVIDCLEQNGLRENTIVIFMSDNGHSEETANRIRVDNHKSGYPKDHFYGASGGGATGRWIGQKGSFLEGGIRVPAIISYPAKLPQGRVRPQVITVMDWFSTVLDLCGVKQPVDSPKLDGYSLRSIIEGHSATSEYKTLHFAWGNKWAVRLGDWKLIGNTRNSRVSLHNLTDAKPEVKDHAKEKPKVVARLRSIHEQWAEEVARK